MAGGDGKDKKAEPQEYKFATKPVELTGWEGFKQFLWNSETSEFLGRTGMSWCKFYLFSIILVTSLLQPKKFFQQIALDIPSNQQCFSVKRMVLSLLGLADNHFLKWLN